MNTQNRLQRAILQSGKLALQAAFTRKQSNFFSLFLCVAVFLTMFSPGANAQTPGYSKTGGTTQNDNLLNSSNTIKTQLLYLPGDFTPVPISGSITRIYFRNSVAGTTGTYNNFKVFMGQTTATVFPGTGSLDFFTGLTQVVNSPTKTLTGNATAGNWFFIDLDTPFNYDNTQTLIIEVQCGLISGGIKTFATSSGVIPAHKKIFSTNTAAISGTQETNGWQNLGVDITPFPACSGTPNAGTAVSSVATACVNAPFELSLTGTSLVSGLTYQWQSSPNGTTGWTNIAGATNNRFTTSQSATTFYRANVSCGTNTASSSSVQVTTSAAALSGTFTINKNSPVSATNYQSFTSFISDIICKGVSGPVTVNVTAGSGPYNEQLNLTAIPGASATNTITFNGNGNKITTANTTPSRAVITLNGADFIKFDNFQVEAPDLSFGWGFHLINGADNNTINNNTITIASTNTLEGASAGIFFTNSTTSATTGNTGNENVIIGNTIIGGHTGINLNSLATATGNNQIKNNIIKDFYENGIKIANAKGTLIEGNDISRPNRNVGFTLYGIHIFNGSLSTVISKNRIHNTHDATGTVTISQVSPIYFNTDAPAGSENIVKNNLIYNINNATGALYAFYNNGSDGVYYYHNTINLDNAAPTGEVRGFFQTGAASNIRFINNIIAITAGSGTKTALFFETATSLINSNNNALYVPNGNVGNFSAVNKPTLADWKAANGGIYDQNSVSANPNFVNVAAGNLTPGNSTINNIGQPIAAVTDDFTGAARSTTTPDPGAYEFATPTTNDAGVTAIITPASPVAPGLSNVEVVIKNYGSAALTSASITWSVNSVAQTPFAWTGNLPSGASALVTIGTYTFVSGAFTLEVCTATPNGVTDDNTSNDCISISGSSCAPLAGTFTIDKNSPSSATNYQTLAAAIQNITSCGVSGPVTFNVVAGTGPYNEQLVLTPIPGTNAANLVKFEGNGNKISFATTTANRPVVRFDGADFITFNNFEIEATDPTFGWGIHFTNGADNNTISNSTITIASTNTAEANSAGIVFSNSNTQVNIGGNTGNNNLIIGNTFNGGFKAIHVNSIATMASNNQLKNNIIKDFYTVGITVSAARGTLVEGNDISRPTRATVSGSMQGIAIDNSSATVISKNRIHNTHAVATSLTGAVWGIATANADAPAGSENIIKNNLIYNINTNGAVNAIISQGSDGTHFFNNTIDLSRTTSTGALRGFYQSQTATNVKFINNIITITAGTGVKNALYFEAPTSSITSNNNVLFVPGGNIGTIATAPISTFATLANWKTANSNAYDQNSVSDDPTYVGLATGNLQPGSALINNIGQPVAAVTDDITGAPRHATTPDAGAYEFGIAPSDVGVISVSGPVTTGCGLTNAETITVTIRNFGGVVQTSVPVTFSVNGTLVATETFTGNLTPNTTATYTFTAKANLSISGPYAIVASTALTGDGDAANDAKTLNVANALFPSLPVALDFETANTGLPRLKRVISPNANLTEGNGASNGSSSTKGLIMDGIDSFSWTVPAGIINPWTANPDHFSAVYFCVTPGTGNPKDSLHLSFDLKQLFKTSFANTNFRVTVNGVQVGPTYRPPFSGTPINWQRINVDLTSYMNQPTIEIGLESNVKEEYDNGNGTANLIDNILVERIAAPNTGINENVLQSNVVVFPNPSTGLFNLKVPVATRNYTIEVTDLTGKVVKQQIVKNNAGAEQLNLNGAAKGIYILKVTSEEKVATRKLIVE